MVEFRQITIENLPGYLDSKEFKTSEILPISSHRALSYLNNPRTEKDDTVLFLAYLKNRLVAYLGVLPDTIFLNGHAHKAGWYSCMLVDPVARGQGIAKQFMQKAFEAWDDALLVTEFTPEASGLYNKTGRFMKLHQSVGARFYLRTDMTDVMSRKWPAGNSLKPFYRLGDEVFNSLYNLELNRWSNAQHSTEDESYTIQPAGTVEGDLKTYIENNFGDNIERRGAAELNWIRNWPWVLSADTPTEESERYHFTAVDHRFENDHFVMRSANGEVVAYCMLSIRNRMMKIPYCYCESMVVPGLCVEIVRRMIEHQCSTLLVFHPQLVQELSEKGRYPFLHKRAAQRNYIISKKFESELQKSPTPCFQDGDADPVFT